MKKNEPLKTGDHIVTVKDTGQGRYIIMWRVEQEVDMQSKDFKQFPTFKTTPVDVIPLDGDVTQILRGEAENA